MKLLRLAVLGLGRIGRLHLRNLCTTVAGVEVAATFTSSADGKSFSEKFRVKSCDDVAEIFQDPRINAVLVCSPTSTHADYVEEAARADKAIFCEKPLDLSLNRVRDTLRFVERSGVPLMLAFNQRYDPDFRAIKRHVAEGRIGKIDTIRIVSRDPTPPPIKYIQHSGGLFMDMTIHDFDMARYIVGAEATEVYAKGDARIDPDIGAAGDIDTGIVILQFKNGTTAIIENSRKAVYGYDQRLEVFGSHGMIKAKNHLKNSVKYYDEFGGHHARHTDFFMDRYASSYLLEIEAFLDALRHGKPMPVSGTDGLQAMIIADAANQSLKEMRPVKLAISS